MVSTLTEQSKGSILIRDTETKCQKHASREKKSIDQSPNKSLHLEEQTAIEVSTTLTVIRQVKAIACYQNDQTNP